MSNTFIKPPLGVSPHWWVHNRRIKELSEAITRYADFTGDHNHTLDVKAYYELMAKWATEIKLLAEAEAKLLKGDEQ